jgi:SNF2 family DNA or RNA helicase
MPAAKDEVSASLEGGITLRPYQREGANWLLWSRKQGRSVILGDEMGLGKTMQVVACLRHQVVEWGCDGPFLVVAPLSTIGHWERELGRAPELRPQVLRGPAAERRAQLREGGPSGVRAWTVLITTYETLLSDARALQGIEWSGLVFDEAQRLKNAKSKSFAAAAALRCEHKVLLSGTPLQNSVGELWSLLHLLSPTGFADEVAFGRRFGGLETARQATALSSLLRPFLLRRTKADVEVSLEPLTEMLIYVEVTALQKMTYRAICERNRELLVPSERGGKRSSLSFRNLEARDAAPVAPPLSTPLRPSTPLLPLLRHVLTRLGAVRRC